MDKARHPEPGLWDFSLAFYAKPGVAEACIALQDEGGRDVNIILYCAWFGMTGRGRLDPAGLAQADAAVASFRERVIKPLRAARRAIKETALADATALYEPVKAVELAAEQIAQGLLAAIAPPLPAVLERDPVAAAAANVVLYAGTSPAAQRIIDAVAR